MIHPDVFFKQLTKFGIEFYSGVPDSLLKDVCAYISDNVSGNKHIITANEGNALSLGIGYHLATNRVPMIYMQNSGLGNIINPLLSLADPDVYSIPMLLMIGWRGQPDTSDEPQHKKQGKITLELLSVMGVKYYLLKKSDDDKYIESVVEDAIAYAKENKSPVALVVQKGVFEKYNLGKLLNNGEKSSQMKRKEVIEQILLSTNDSDVIVSTTGVTSRELFEVREESKQGHSKDFLTVGGMGHAAQIALGIAIEKPERNIYCLDGDGAILMHMGSAVINAAVGGTNYKHILLNNNAHESVGGQSTLTSKVDFVSLAKSIGYKWVEVAESIDDLICQLSVLSTVEGPAFLEVKIRIGHFEGLGRPTTTPIQNKNDLMRFLSV